MTNNNYQSGNGRGYHTNKDPTNSDYINTVLMEKVKTKTKSDNSLEHMAEICEPFIKGDPGTD